MPREQLDEQISREMERLQREFERQKDRLAEQEDRVGEYSEDNELQEIQMRERLRLERARLEKEYRLSREQLEDQKAKQEAELEARHRGLVAERREEDAQLRIQEIAWEARFKLSMHSLQGPIFRNKLRPPQLDLGGRIASERYRKYYRDLIKAWKDQRKHEERRIQELQKAKEAIAAVRLDSYVHSSQARFDNSARQANIRLAARARESIREARSRSYEIRYQREQQLSRRRIEDARFQERLRRMRDAGYRIDAEQIERYRERLARRRRSQDDAFERQERDVQESIERQAEANKDQKEDLDRQMEDGKKDLDRRIRDVRQEHEREKRDSDEQMDIWASRRREEEARVDEEFSRWLEDQQQALAEYEQVLNRR